MKTKLLLLLLLCIPLRSLAQNCGAAMIPISIEERTTQATKIVEGKITNSQSYWDATQSNIYTVHTIEIYKNIKSNTSSTIQIVTMGGQVGQMIQTVSDAAILGNGDTGLFFLKPFSGNLALSQPLYELVSTAQGVVKYSRFDNKASDVFSQYNSVDNDLYTRVRAVTRSNFQVVSERPVPNLANRNSLAAPVISGFSPTTATAGTQTVLTITGSNFGSTNGVVGFANANSGGSNFITALDTQIVSWSDTQIQVEIPWDAGTGAILVTNDSSESTTSSANLTISYAHINATATGSSGTFDFPTTLPDDDGNGGFTFLYHTEFDSSAARADFEGAFELWNCESNINFSFGGTTTTDATANDGVNVVRFDNGSELPSTTLGRVSAYYTGVCGSNAVVSEMDITWNDDTNWHYGSGNPGASAYDFKSVALHELGHSHQLGHVVDGGDVMHYAIGSGTSNYGLGQNNIDASVYTMGLFTTNQGCGVTPAMSEKLICCDDIVITTQPEDASTEENGNASFTVDGNTYTTIQWQESTDGGSTWSDLSDSAPFSGTSTTTLTITAAPGILNGDMYRAVFGNECSESLNSDTATLTVIEYTLIPDSNFENALSAYDDQAGDGRVPTNNINTVTDLDIRNDGISDLTGIEDFTALEELNISNNNLTQLDVSNNTALEQLIMFNNNVTTLDLSNNPALTFLSAGNNNMSSLDFGTNSNIQALFLQDNNLTSFDATGFSALTWLGLNNNPITSLDLSMNTALQIFVAEGCNLTELNLQNGINANLNSIDCTNNPLLFCVLVDDAANINPAWTNRFDAQVTFSDTECATSYIAIPDSNFETALSDLNLDDNLGDNQVPLNAVLNLTSLDVSSKSIADLTGIEAFISLTALNVSNNNLTSLDLSSNNDLTDVNASENGLTTVDLSNATQLSIIDLSDNDLTSMDLSAFANLTEIYLDSNNLTDVNIQNGANGNITNLDLQSNDDLLCVLVNDENIVNTATVNTDTQTRFSNVSCDYTAIPDINFEIALDALGLDDNYTDGLVPTSYINTVTSLDVSNSNIADLTGIADFTALEQLTVSDNSLASLNLSSNSALTSITVSNNSITALDVSANAALQTLIVDGNPIMELDLSTLSSLNNLQASGCNLTVLNIKNGNNSNITTANFNTTNNPLLNCVLVDNVAFAEANFTNKDAITSFSSTQCDTPYVVIPDSNFEAELFNQGYDDIENDNQVPRTLISVVTTLSVRNENITDLTGIEAFVSLTVLNVSFNNLSTLDLTNNTAFERLTAYSNDLTTINLNGLTQLKGLALSFNQLTSLDLSSFTNLDYLELDNNNLSDLNIRNGNNGILSGLYINANPNLTCVLVDDEDIENSSTTVVADDQTRFSSTYCDYTAIPDPNFEAALYALDYDDIPNDGQVPTEIVDGITSLNIENQNISDLTGIEAFVALDELRANDNNISSVDFSSNTVLRRLFLRNNNITTMDLTSNTNIQRLLVESNGMTDLNLTGVWRLDNLFAANNNLTELDLSTNVNLQTVGLGNNDLTFLNIKNGQNGRINIWQTTNNPNLTCILVDNVTYAEDNFTNIDPASSFSDTYCRYTQIPDTAFEEALRALNYDDSTSNDGQVPTALIEVVTSLDISSEGISDLTGIQDFVALQTLTAADNQFESINLNTLTQLTELSLQGTDVDAIDLSNNTLLTALYLEETQLITLDVSANELLEILDVKDIAVLTDITFGNNTALRILDAAFNDLTSLDLNAFPALEQVLVNGNELTTLRVKNGTNGIITNFNATGNPNLTCINVDDITFAEANFNVDVTANFVDTAYCEYTTIPDIIFETALDNLGYDDNLGDGQVPTTLIEVVTSLDIESQFSVQGANITDITGIEDFTALTSLAITFNDLVTVDLSNNVLLEELNLRDNELTSIDVSALSLLEVLNITDNDIPNIDLSSNTALRELDVKRTFLTSLDVSNNTALEILKVEQLFSITSLNLDNNQNLIELSISETQIESLDLSQKQYLTSISLLSNSLTYLNIQNGANGSITFFDARFNPNLTCILVDNLTQDFTNWVKDDAATYSDTYCRYTAVPEIDFEDALDDLGYDDNPGDGQVPTALIEVVTSLDVSGESISDFTGLQDFVALQDLDAGNNTNATIDLSNLTNLEHLNLNGSPITGLDLSNNLQLKTIDIDDGGLITTLDVSNNTLLEDLRAIGNALTTVTFGNQPDLETVRLSSNNIETLDLSTLPGLKIFTAGSNALTSIDFSNNPVLATVTLSDNPVGEVDLSGQPLLNFFIGDNAELTYLNLKNGYTDDLEFVNITDNPNLTCVLVDDITGNFSNWVKDDVTNYSDTYCRYTQIPDIEFEQELASLGYDDITDDNQVPTALIENVTALTIIINPVTDLTGIEDFVSLEELSLGEQTIANLDLTANTQLKNLDAQVCNIAAVDISNNPLIETIDLRNVQLNTIEFPDDLSNLSNIDVARNNLESLNLSTATALRFIQVNDNNLSFLNVQNGNNENVVTFDAQDNTNLNCILVDDVTQDFTNWAKDNTATYTDTYCRYTAIPDIHFEARLNAMGYDDNFGDGFVPTALIEGITSLNIEYMVPFDAISDLTGIEDFVSLTSLNAIANDLDTADFSNNILLEELNLGYNDLSSLNVSTLNSLQVLNVYDSLLTNIDLSNNTNLKELEVSYNNLTSLDVSNNTALEVLVAEGNVNITSINLDNNVNLIELNISSAQIESLDLSNLSSLTSIDVAENSLTYLNVKNGANSIINSFDASFNSDLECILVDDLTQDFTNWSKDATANYSDTYCRYTAIPDANFEAALRALDYDNSTTNDGQVPTALIETVISLNVNSQNITDLTGIEDFEALTVLFVEFNELTSLDVSNLVNLEELYVSTNQLTSIDVSNLENLTRFYGRFNDFESLDFTSNTLLYELNVENNNTLTSLDISGNVLLDFVDISDCAVSNLDLSQLTQLTSFDATNNTLESIDLSNNSLLFEVYLSNNPVGSIDLSNQSALEYFEAINAELTSLNFQNGNNENIQYFDITNNPNLTCILVDDVTQDFTNWSKDNDAFYSDIDCRYTAIPDANFETRLNTLGYDDFLGDGQVPTALIENVTSLTISGPSVSDMTGIEDFIALRTLNAISQNFTTIDLSNLTDLEVLRIGSDVLEEVDVSNNVNLKEIDLAPNSGIGILESLDLSNNTVLEIVDVENNNLESITFADSYPDLSELNLGYNELTTLDLSGMPNISLFSARNNNLTYLNLKNRSQLINFFNIQNNNNLSCILVDAEDLDYANDEWDIDSQMYFSAYDCIYTSIPDANFEAALDALGYDDFTGDGQVPTALIEGVTSLTIDNANISDLTGIEDFTSLEVLDVASNNLTSIDVSNNLQLLELDAAVNNLTALDVSVNTLMTLLNVTNNELTAIDLSNNTALTVLTLGTNQLTELDLTNNTVLQIVSIKDNLLSAVDLRNGNNTGIFAFNAEDNPDLTCILVDNADYSTTTWTNIDDQTTFNEVSCTTIDFSLALKVYLQGPALNPNTGEENLMRDDLRVAGLIPTTSPYADGLTVVPSVFDTTGDDAIVDWIWVELRDQTDNTIVSYARSALLQRDGDVVNVDGISPLDYTTAEDKYYVIVNHRNHLGVMKSFAELFFDGATTVIDFTSAQFPQAYGSNAQTTIGMPGGVYGMWAGDAESNGDVNFGFDGNKILLDLFLHPDNTTFSSSFAFADGYSNSDIDLDGFITPQVESNNLLLNVFLYPLNTSFSSSYSLLVEQLPTTQSQSRSNTFNVQGNSQSVANDRAMIQQQIDNIQTQITNRN